MTIVDHVAKRKTRTKLPPPPAADLTPAKPPPTQLCLRHPACGGPERCVDCRDGKDGPATGDAPESGPVMTKDKLKRLRFILDEVLAGLDGKPFLWGAGQRAAFLPALRALGVELVSLNGAKERGHLLKLRTAPVGRAHFGAPVQRWVDLYVLDVQTRPAETPPARKGARSPEARA